MHLQAKLESRGKLYMYSICIIHFTVFNSYLLELLVERLLKLVFPSAPLCHLGFTQR